MPFHQYEVSLELASEQAVRLLRRLQLDDNLIIYDQIGAKRIVKLHPVIFKGNRHLSLYLMTTTNQLCGKDHLVNRFEQPWPQALMQLHSRINHIAAYLVFKCHLLPYQHNTPSVSLCLCVRLYSHGTGIVERILSITMSLFTFSASAS